KTLRGKGATERKGRVCNRKPALKRTLRRRRAAKFVRSKKALKHRKIEYNEIFRRFLRIPY
ncbi:MAG: hypothetical protein IJN25_05300, partial [Clostridia bacterium]|nr:hypothetical protein [Clostridia bacterium]